MRRKFLILLAILLALSACNIPPAPQQTATKNLGIEKVAVLKVVPTPDGVLLYVSSLINEQTQMSGMGRVRVYEDCPVIDRTGESGKLVDLGFLSVGQFIDVTYETMTEGVPWVAVALKLEVLTPGAIESGVPMSHRLSPDLIGKVREYKTIQLDSGEGEVIVMDNITSARYPNITEGNLLTQDQTLVWKQEGDDFLLVTLESVVPGDRLSILLDYSWHESTPYDFNAAIQEIVILDD